MQTVEIEKQIEIKVNDDIVDCRPDIEEPISSDYLDLYDLTYVPVVQSGYIQTIWYNVTNHRFQPSIVYGVLLDVDNDDQIIHYWEEILCCNGVNYISIPLQILKLFHGLIQIGFKDENEAEIK